MEALAVLYISNDWVMTWEGAGGQGVNYVFLGGLVAEALETLETLASTRPCLTLISRAIVKQFKNWHYDNLIASPLSVRYTLSHLSPDTVIFYHTSFLFILTWSLCAWPEVLQSIFFSLKGKMGSVDDGAVI